jgi:hypothetical protein
MKLRFTCAFFCAVVAVVACSSSNTTPGTGSSGTAASCTTAPKLEKDDYCATCTMSAGATPAECRPPRVVNACCTWVQAPEATIARGVGLNRYSNNDPTVQLGCLDSPDAMGTPKTVTLKGHVRLFSSGGDSAGVKIEIFKEGDNGALGEKVGQEFVTTMGDESLAKKEDWLEKCPETGCIYRPYTYAGVPTETRLVIKTSDAAGGDTWAALYLYNAFFTNSQVTTDATLGEVIVSEPSPGVNPEPISAVAATDINTIASAAGGFTVKADKGLLAGEVHDCGDIRLSGATVDIDAAHEGEMFYFGENETNPLPDKTRGARGTSRLGLFGTLNVTTGVPTRVSAIGNFNGQTVLVGSSVVQTFPRSVTAIRFRGRRPWQK